jgi:hypothetical protein
VLPADLNHRLTPPDLKKQRYLRKAGYARSINPANFTAVTAFKNRDVPPFTDTIAPAVAQRADIGNPLALPHDLPRPIRRFVRLIQFYL